MLIKNIFSGSCSIESKEQFFEVSEFLIEQGVRVLRAAINKYRSSAYDFQGVGVEAIERMKELKAKHQNIKFITEIFRPEDVDELQDVVDTYCGTHLVTFGGSSSCVVSTNPSPTALTSGDYFTVTVRYQYDFLLTPAFITDLAGGIELVATTTMRAE